MSLATYVETCKPWASDSVDALESNRESKCMLLKSKKKLVESARTRGMMSEGCANNGWVAVAKEKNPHDCCKE